MLGRGVSHRGAGNVHWPKNPEATGCMCAVSFAVTSYKAGQEMRGGTLVLRVPHIVARRLNLTNPGWGRGYRSSGCVSMQAIPPGVIPTSEICPEQVPLGTPEGFAPLHRWWGSIPTTHGVSGIPKLPPPPRGLGLISRGSEKNFRSKRHSNPHFSSFRLFLENNLLGSFFRVCLRKKISKPQSPNNVGQFLKVSTSTLHRKLSARPIPRPSSTRATLVHEKHKSGKTSNCEAILFIPHHPYHGPGSISLEPWALGLSCRTAPHLWQKKMRGSYHVSG